MLNYVIGIVLIFALLLLALVISASVVIDFFKKLNRPSTIQERNVYMTGLIVSGLLVFIAICVAKFIGA